jgi:hypothetical protein
MLDETKMLTEGWSETKEVLLDGLTGSKRNITEQVLENTRNHMITETAPAGSIQAHDIANFRKNLLPLIRRIIPGTFATEIVGVQPMTGPVSQVFSMKYKYAEDVTHDASRSQFGGYDIASGDEVFGNAKPIRQFYSGTVGAAQDAGASGITAAGADGTSAPADIDAATATGEGWGSSLGAAYANGTDGTTLYGEATAGSLYGGSGSHLEASGGRKMVLDVISQAVQAKTRKLQAGWTIESMQDAKSQHNLNIESEIVKGLSATIAQEIDAEIINDLLALAGTIRGFDFTVTAGTTYAPAFVGDRFSNLGVKINEVANEIARKTRKAAGNFIVCSPMIVSVLQSATKAVFAPAVEGSFKSPTNNALVGTLNGTIKVYSYLWNQAAPGTTDPYGSDKILVGLKGGNGELDAGYFYCPYVPVMSTGVIMNPVTHNPVVGLMTRYAKAVFTDPTISLGNSADYYSRITVQNLEFL